jgi:predicted enzyme related to lactoylglutathione lyase
LRREYVGRRKVNEWLEMDIGKTGRTSPFYGRRFTWDMKQMPRPHGEQVRNRGVGGLG